MKWGHYQKKCHELLDEVFDSKKDAYTWLVKNFGVQHFSELDPKKDKELIDRIYAKLYIKSILE